MQKFQLRLSMIYMYRLCQSMKIKDDFKSKIFLPLEFDEILLLVSFEIPKWHGHDHSTVLHSVKLKKINNFVYINNWDEHDRL